jgi:PAS domain S-box-containing protein
MKIFHIDWEPAKDRVEVSPAQPTLLGRLSPKTLADYLARVHPEDRETYRASLAALEPARPTYLLRYRLVDDDGHAHAVEERGVGRFDGRDGPPARAAIVSGSEGPLTLPGIAPRDTEQDPDALLRKILDASLNGLYVYDLDQGRDTFINSRYTALTGYTLDALDALGADGFIDRFHPDDRPAIARHMERMRTATDDAHVEIEYRFRHRDGHWIWCLSVDSVLERGVDGRARSMLGTFLDVTASRQADAALRESRSREQAHLSEIEHIYATAPVGLCVLDRDLRFVRINERLAQINGLSVEAHLGRTVAEVIPGVADTVEGRLRRVIESGEPLLDLELEGETPARPGVRRTWIESWLPMRNAGGHVVGINIVADEVTEQRRVEREKAADAALLQALFDNAAVGIAQVELDGRFARFNQRLCDITGYDRAELGRLRFQEITHPDDLAEDLVQVQQLVNGEIAVYRMEKRYLHKGGQSVWVKLTGSIVRDADGAPAYFVAIVDDVSARREAESRARTLAKVVETSTDFIGVATLDGHGIYLNPAGRKMVGIDAAAVAETIVEAYLFDEDLTFVREIVMPTVWRDGRWAGEFRFRHFRTGEAVDVFWDVVRIDDPASGEPELLATVTRDIRTQKATENELRTANRRKDEFLAVMGHELRNPMAPIRSAVDILLMRDSGDDPDIERTLHILDRQTRHLGRLLDDLLDISSIERGRLRLDRRPVPIDDLLQEATHSVQDLIGERGQQLEITQATPGLVVDGDPVRLTQILLNLLLNAASYTQKGGRVRLSADAAEDQVIIRVRDNGPGLSPEVLEGLFTPFTRKGGAADSSQQGLGLGLAISRRLAELHGGRLEARNNRKGPGAVFSLHLPRVADGTGQRRRVAKARPSGGPARTVLVVEDNSDVASAMAMLIEMLGHRAEIAASGRQALAVTEDWCPGLALLDIGLPDMDGLELARRLRARYPDRATMQLVAVTGFGHEEARERSRAAGIDEHLAKPVELATLQRLLEPSR